MVSLAAPVCAPPPLLVASSAVTEREPSTAARAAWDSDELPEGQAKAHAVREMFDTIAPRYDLLNRIMTFRLDSIHATGRRAANALAPARGPRPRAGAGQRGG